MSTTREQIKQWFDEGKAPGVTHMIVAVDRFDSSDYPVYVRSPRTVKEAIEKLQKTPMTGIMEVYSYALDRDKQLDEVRAYHIDEDAHENAPDHHNSRLN